MPLHPTTAQVRALRLCTCCAVRPVYTEAHGLCTLCVRCCVSLVLQLVTCEAVLGIVSPEWAVEFIEGPGVQVCGCVCGCCVCGWC